MNNQTSIYQSTDLNEQLMSGKNEKNAKIVNPKTGKLSFGRVPDNNNDIPSGDIYLKLGLMGRGFKRYGAFGARHIWEKHNVDLCIPKQEMLPQIIADMLVEGTNVLVNFAIKNNKRPVVLNTKLGRVALEPEMKAGKTYYSIVSAYGNKNAPGTVIGTLKSPIE
ncbi:MULTISPECIES: hypothetical protein [Aliivibrio]|uniref:Uncharacterized protein n=1 Tax=Aliivibrio finisterrensis TaxID=511998 RepID=A0A6N6RWP4_9GAMM|nr:MULTISPECIES: hypothetical protein [Aliivibrio]KAB2825791.1 hypothetical protein F8B77_03625 [Aliivibrio finisterrensis]